MPEGVVDLRSFGLVNVRRDKGASLDVVRAIVAPPTFERTIDGASVLTATLTDPQRRLLRSKGFGADRMYVETLGLRWELAGISKSGSTLTLTFEDAVVAQLRRQRDKRVFPAGTVTLAQVAEAFAREAGVDVSVDPEHRGVINSPVERSVGGEVTDSWEVLGSLAEDRGWRRFSDGKRLVIGSDRWLMGRRAPVTVAEQTSGVLDIDFDLDVGRRAASATLAVDVDLWTLAPGDAVSLDKCGAADGRWLVESFNRTLTSVRGSVTLTRARHSMTEPPPETADTGEAGFTLGISADSGTPGTGARETMVAFALRQEGKPYDWGKSGPGSYDCSGLVQEATRAAGRTLGKPSASQWATIKNAGRTMSVEDAFRTRGALLFRIGAGATNHVAISLGNGSTIEAMGEAYGVCKGKATGRGWTGAGLWL